jgi:Tfp pilus assembly protein PilF
MHPKSRPLSRLLILWVIMATSMSAQAAAKLHTPVRDQEVVEVLRERPLSREEREWRTLRAQARLAPSNIALASKVAWQALRWARRDGDPRWLGQAQATLGHWWTQTAPPADIRLLRATILQSNHDFDASLRDLQAVVRDKPGEAQAWLTLAAVLRVRGRPAEALAACEGLVRAGANWHAEVCTQELRGQAGEAAHAMRALDTLASQAPREFRGHIQLVRAELAERDGKPDVAAKLYALMLASDEGDAYVEGAYADLLLDQGQADAVIARLKGRERNDALLLRLAEAYDLAGNPARRTAVQALQARFMAAKSRGDRVHQREEARFTLRLLRQPVAALALARSNWLIQKEAADGLLLVEAALAAGQPQAVDEVHSFMQSVGWHDQRLKARP